MTALRAGTRCACGEVMYPHPSRKVITCKHCDTGCETSQCERCRAYQIGSRRKNDALWDPTRELYTEQA